MMTQHEIIEQMPEPIDSLTRLRVTANFNQKGKDMYDKDLAVHETAFPIVKVGGTIPFNSTDGEHTEQTNYFIIKIDRVPYKHSILTMAETMDGPAICYLHNSIRYGEAL